MTGGRGLLKLSHRRVSVMLFALFFSWLLAFPFEGRILYALISQNAVNSSALVFGSIAAHFTGLITGGFFIKTMRAAKALMVFSILGCLVGSALFLMKPSFLWYPALYVMSGLAGACVATWGYFFKYTAPPGERIKLAADSLILSNALMILLNMVTLHVLPLMGLGLSMLFLLGSLFFAFRLPETDDASWMIDERPAPSRTPKRPLVLLCLFIALITINSGFMYQVINPAYSRFDWLAGWYWAIPYIAAIFLMRRLSARFNRVYMLYVAIAMMGLAFICFMAFKPSVLSYLLVNTLMMGACGLFDLFWWSILGEMLDFADRPGKVLGIGLSANVLGVLLGGLLGSRIIGDAGQTHTPSLLALVIIFMILMLLPLLQSSLFTELKHQAGSVQANDEKPMPEMSVQSSDFDFYQHLTPREKEIAALLLRGRTYKLIAAELYLSENTVKTHIKNIYSKFNIRSKTEFLKLISEKTGSM